MAHDDEEEFVTSGKYLLCFNSEDDYSVCWIYNDKEKQAPQYELNKDTIRVISHELIGHDVGFPCTMTGNPTLTSHTSDGDCTL
jgi:hypothetical protein